MKTARFVKHFAILICAFSLFSANALCSELEFEFVEMWPELPQPWYFDTPEDVEIDTEGNMYVADTNNDRIVKLNSEGSILWERGKNGRGTGEFMKPSGIAVSLSGIVYVSDMHNDRIQKFDSQGNFIKSWGHHGDGDGQFYYPEGIAVDVTGNVYVADTRNNRVQKFDSEGRFLKKWGNEGDGDSEFCLPGGIAADEAGYIYVSDSGNDRIQKFDCEGGFVLQWGSYGSSLGQFNDPRGIATDASGNVYVADNLNNRIQIFSSEGIVIESWRDFESNSRARYQPFGIDVAGSGDVYMAVPYRDSILKLDSSGNQISSWGSSGDEQGKFDEPIGVDVDENGNIYVLERGNRWVQIFDEKGTFLNSSDWGFYDFIPEGIASGDNGFFFVSDTYHDQILKVAFDGSLSESWGTTGSENGQFNYPSDLAVDENGSIYVADKYNRRVQKLNSSGGYIDEWCLELDEPGEFGIPGGITADLAGNVYVSDSRERRIQKFDPDGSLLQKWEKSSNVSGEGSCPAGIGSDQEGNIYVADTWQHCIRIFTSEGESIAQLGSYGSDPGLFKYPNDVALSNSDLLYVADRDNNRIQVFRKVDSSRTGSLRVTISPLTAINAGAKWRVDGGLWRNSGATASGLHVGNHTVSYNSITGWDSPADDPLAVGEASTTTVSGTYIPLTGLLKVTISPQEAIDAGAKWRVDGGSWQSSGAIASGLVVGNHIVSYYSVYGWASPGDESVAVTAGATSTALGTYTQQTGSLKVTIYPQEAIDAGAKWRVDAGAWRSSGATASGLSPGNHTVSFDSIYGWNSPGDKTVSVSDGITAAASGTYTRQTGSLKVTISPQEAVTAGAKWRVDGGAWRNSGAIASGLSVASHAVSFSSVTGWNSPDDQSVSVGNGTTAAVSCTYSPQTGALKVTIYPQEAIDAGAKWRVDAGAWRNSGTIASGLTVGNHAVSYDSIYGWDSPGAKSVYISNGTTASTSGTYTQQTGALKVTVYPQEAVSAGAKWRVDGGVWKNSGATASGLSVGNHIVSFYSVYGWASPGDESIAVGDGATAATSGTYTKETGSLKVTIYPQETIDSGAKWRVDGGSLQNSGATVSGLSVGSHTVSFSSITGWDSPQNQSVVVSKGNTTAINGTYIAQGFSGKPSKAIIVSQEGLRPGSYDFISVGTCINAAHGILDLQGYDDETIYRLSDPLLPGTYRNRSSYQTDGSPSKESIRQAILEWASDANDLLLYMVGHGGNGNFQPNQTELLKAQELDSWLDSLQAKIPGKIVLIYEACESGSFLPGLVPPYGKEKERLVLTSTDTGQKAIIASQGQLSFSFMFWTNIGRGETLYAAYDQACKNLFPYREDDQTPMVEANGNGVGNEKEDKKLADEVYIGLGASYFDDIPTLGDVLIAGRESGWWEIERGETTDIRVFDVIDADGIERVWMTVVPPETAREPLDEPITDLNTAELTHADGNIYETTYQGFTVPGTYTVAIMASDTEGLVSMPASAIVTVVETPREIHYVEEHGDCTDKDFCYSNIRDAANEGQSGCVIRLAPGTYRENATFGPGTRVEIGWDASFTTTNQNNPVIIRGPLP